MEANPALMYGLKKEGLKPWVKDQHLVIAHLLLGHKEKKKNTILLAFSHYQCKGCSTLKSKHIRNLFKIKVYTGLKSKKAHRGNDQTSLKLSKYMSVIFTSSSNLNMFDNRLIYNNPPLIYDNLFQACAN